MLELNEGDVLAGRYTLVRKLGTGAMSSLWRANDRRTDSQVALKFSSDDSADGGRRLKKEWQIASRLMHANIIRVFEYGEDGNYYAMQYINGPSIAVVSGGDIEGVLRPAGLLADALRYAHGKGLVHRDIKASNVLLDSRGLPYLIDFGTASVAGSTGATGGTDIAMSPEQRNGQPPDGADDIYALGVLLHELICGEPPPVATLGNATDIADIVDSAGRPLPGAVSRLLRDMLSANAAARPSAAEVVEQLAAAGFPAGAAPRRHLDKAVVDVQPLKAESVQLQRRHAALETSGASARSAMPAHSRSAGVPPGILYGGLGIAALVFLGVVFLLPPSDEKFEQTADSATPDIAESGLDVAATPETEPVATAERQSAGPRREAIASDAAFSENQFEAGGTSEERIKAATDEALGDLLSRIERLRFRGVERWGGQPYLSALDVYKEGDRAYVANDYATAGKRYRETIALIDPLFGQIEREFASAMAAGTAAFTRGDHVNAVQGFDLAVAISPGNMESEAWLKRALNLNAVQRLVDQALAFEANIELDAARIAFEQALQLDASWQPAIEGLARIQAALRQLNFDTRMTEGLDALSAGDFASARAAFNAAKAIIPESRQPADGLIQVDQEIRLQSIRRLETESEALEANEEWENAIIVYEDILKIDRDLQFAKEGLARSRQRADINKTLNTYIDDPDSLSSPVTMQNATRLLLDLSRISPVGPRLEDQKNSLSRLLKRAATPLDVFLVSDGVTDVSVMRVARFGAFQSKSLSLRPGVYVAVGVRAGYRDVRIEFRVAPEIEMKPVVVQCEERI